MQIVDYHRMVVGAGPIFVQVGMVRLQVWVRMGNVIFEIGRPKPDCRDNAKGCDPRQHQERGVQPEWSYAQKLVTA